MTAAGRGSAEHGQSTLWPASTDLTAGSGQRNAPENKRSEINVRGKPHRARLFRCDSRPREPYRLTLAHTGCRTSKTSAFVSATQCKSHCHTDTSFNLGRPGMVMRSMVAAAKAVKRLRFPIASRTSRDQRGRYGFRQGYKCGAYGGAGRSKMCESLSPPSAITGNGMRG
jgi:hypothetical protein